MLESVVIQQLQALAGELKRTPKVSDIEVAARQNKCPGIETIRAEVR
jgi:hypothetical protein